MPAGPASRGRSLERGELEARLRKAGYTLLCGVDEAGRGPLAGPVVAGAVILPPDWDDPGVDDSKRLTPRRREQLAEAVQQTALACATGVVEADEIDRLNIHNSSLLAMQRAVRALSVRPDYLLVDGRFPVPMDLPQEPVVSGDSLCPCISAASILAKVLRDRIMLQMHQRWPQYGFDSHKGYPTAAHRAALAQHGPCPIHRQSYSTVAQAAFDWGDGGA